MSNINISKDIIIQAAVIAVVWGVTQYFVRLGLNSDVNSNLASYQKDTLYSMLAVFVAVVLYFIIIPRFALSPVI